MPRISANRASSSGCAARPSMSGSDQMAHSVNLTAGVSAQQLSSLAQLKASPRSPAEASFFYFDHHFQTNAVKVLPGEYFVSALPVVIMTVLGSCIAACLWDA